MTRGCGWRSAALCAASIRCGEVGADLRRLGGSCSQEDATSKHRLLSCIVAAGKTASAPLEHEMKRKVKVHRRRDDPAPGISETAVELSSAPATPGRSSVERVDEHKTGSNSLDDAASSQSSVDSASAQ